MVVSYENGSLESKITLVMSNIVKFSFEKLFLFVIISSSKIRSDKKWH